jgi:hypothetical protein
MKRVRPASAQGAGIVPGKSAESEERDIKKSATMITGFANNEL